MQFNKISWDIIPLGENTTLLQGPADIQIEKIHESTRLIKDMLGKVLLDVVPSYNSIALFHSHEDSTFIEKLATTQNLSKKKSISTPKIQIPICYEMGQDLDEVAEYAGLSQEEMIRIHLDSIYRAILIGFTPGFIYMDGLDERLACPRKSNPRKFLEGGSVGIGGEQTGIYSLASPGGWNVIGRTPLQIFDSKREPPMSVEVGAKISYYRITKEEFELWEN